MPDPSACRLLSVLNQYKLHQRQLVYNGTTLARCRLHSSHAKQCACRFIVVLHQYGLLSQISAAAWDADCQDLRPLDATSLRQQKVERFKRDRDIKAKLQQVGCLHLTFSIQGSSVEGF